MNDLDLYRLHRSRARRAFAIGSALAAAGLVLIARAAFAQPAAPASSSDPTVDQFLSLLRFAGGAFKAGMWFVAAVSSIIAIVFALRLWGKRLHDMIPDESAFDRPFWFLFDTKPGGVLLNGLTASGVVLTPVLLSGQTMSPALAGATLAAGIGASTAWGWLKDLYGWWKERKPDAAPAQAAGVEAAKATAAKPGTGVDA